MNGESYKLHFILTQPALFNYRKCIKFNRNDERKFFNFSNCNFDHPLKEHKTIVR